MKIRLTVILLILCSAVLISGSTVSVEGDYIKWMDFTIPTSALKKAMKLDIKTHGTENEIEWIEVLSYLGMKYGGNWKKYTSHDMDKLVEKLNSSSIKELTDGSKYYKFYYERYNAVLCGFVGKYAVQSPDGERKSGYGLKVFSPIAKGYYYTHYDDFGDSRSFGFKRRHLGNDLMGSVGTPIIAVESGIVEALGWNKYGGWRIGIRSYDKMRYYYYAHLRKNHPYVTGLKQGQHVTAGDVIGYLGRTGYSTKENSNNIKKPHLHFGIQLIFDESQKECNNEIWINVYDIVNLLESNKAQVEKDEATKDYRNVNKYFFLE
ncbi:MAG: M23 family metallopeptidase [Eubacteriales bacterium]